MEPEIVKIFSATEKWYYENKEPEKKVVKLEEIQRAIDILEEAGVSCYVGLLHRRSVLKRELKLNT